VPGSGAQPYVYWSAGAFLGLATPLTVAFTSTFPEAWGGVRSVHVLAELHFTSDAGAVPKLTVVAFMPTANPVPLTVTAAPPVLVPEFGLTAVTVGVTV
jgi:hypothetical protein